MQAITSQDFFNNVSRDGYPSTKTKAQPWRDIWTGTQGKEPHADGKMIVACAMRHDYGTLLSTSPILTDADTRRILWPRRLLALACDP